MAIFFLIHIYGSSNNHSNSIEPNLIFNNLNEKETVKYDACFIETNFEVVGESEYMILNCLTSSLSFSCLI